MTRTAAVPVAFRDLRVGERFRFPSDQHTGMKTGVLMKVSARTWRYVDDGMHGRVGSIYAPVFRVSAATAAGDDSA